MRIGPEPRRQVKAHRLAFELANDGLSPGTVDHLCHDPTVCERRGPDDPHRLCCNPAHLGPASNAENAARGQQGAFRGVCRAGHQMTEESTYVSPQGARQCRRCSADRMRERRAEAARQRDKREPTRHYRPRGMSREQLVEWLMQDQPDSGCWFWPGTEGGAKGYRTVRVDGRMTAAHRLVYEVTRGEPIPEGLVVDHTCHDPATCEGGLTCPHRACIRPDHLAAVSPEWNTSAARASRREAVECVNGHEFTPENTYTDKRGSRHCRNCMRERALAAAKRPPREKTHCKNGLHELAEDNVFVDSKGNRRCRACRAATVGRYGEKVRATPPSRCPKALHDMTEDNVEITGRGRECRACREAAAVSRCVRGHDYTPENTRIKKRSNGRSHRACKQCARDDAREAYRRKAQAAT
jgi:hypothetical protein